MWICGLFTTICPVKKSISSIAKFKRTIMFKKSTLIAFCALIPAIGFSQSKTIVSDCAPMPATLEVASSTSVIRPDVSAESRGGAIWAETFENAVNATDSIFTSNGAWGKGGLDGGVWKHSTSQSNGCYSFNTGMPDVSTPDDGFLIFDADSVNCVDAAATPPVINETVLQGSISSPVIDLSAFPSVVLGFDYESRWCCMGQALTLELSSDGGATWPTSIELESPLANLQLSTTVEFNISADLGGSATAMFRLTWDEASHYFWVVDDFIITEAPEADTKILSAYVSHNGTGEEYGRIPMNQTDQEMLIGAQVTNFGATIQENLELIADFSGPTPFTGIASVSMLATGDSTFLENSTVTGPLDIGDYIGTFTVSTDTDTAGGPEFVNNVLIREFEVTNSTYSIDGVGVYSDNDLGSIGSRNFTDAADGLWMFAYYDIKETLVIEGIEILLNTNATNGTVAGGTVQVALHDTSEVLNDNVLDPIVTSEALTITQEDVTAGYVWVPFEEPKEITDKQIFAGVELFSNDGDNDIQVIDDRTVPQPFYSSMIFIPGDQTYSNGNAYGIRLNQILSVGIEEAQGDLANMSIVPNPSTGVINVKMNLDGATNLNINVVGIDGAIVETVSKGRVSGVYNQTLDLSGLANGVYFVKVATDNGVRTSKIMIAK
ncbi:MAG: hypothetical protein ACI9FU_001833 [Granulosicoccus sp.]|jgi:hypothetical protein